MTSLAWRSAPKRKNQKKEGDLSGRRKGVAIPWTGWIWMGNNLAAGGENTLVQECGACRKLRSSSVVGRFCAIRLRCLVLLVFGQLYWLKERRGL